MSISPSTIFHFTKTKNDLFGILNGYFEIHYCKEIITLGTTTFTIKVPMASFCDIPFSNITEHMNKYGKYGIGMKKEWARKNSMNPVLYCEPNSDVSNSYNKAILHFGTAQADSYEGSASLVNMVRYIKNYEGTLIRDTETIEFYRYSDEREWRYVPNFNSDILPFIVIDEHSDPDDIQAKETQIATERLSFELDDIKYIILASKAEVSGAVSILKESIGKAKSEPEIQEMISRIIISEEFFSDV